MENNRKLLFFDIDKTLLTPYPWTVPDSAKQALKKPAIMVISFSSIPDVPIQ